MLILDTETTGLKFWEDRIFGIAYCDEKGSGFKRLDDATKKYFCELIKNAPEIAFHNAKFDIHMLKSNGFPVPKKVHDTMIMSALLNENGMHNLQKVATRYLEIPAWKDGVKEYLKVNGGTYEDVPHAIMDEYATADADTTYKLAMKMLPMLEEQGLMGLYEQEMELLNNVMEMEERGMTIDLSLLDRITPDLMEQAKLAQAQVYEEAGQEFNIDSGDQLAKILYDFLKLPLSSFTDKTRKPATDDFALQKLNHPIIKPILAYRSAKHLHKTYCMNIYEYMDKTQLLHCSFRQHAARTGRFSCATPNLQNIPADSIIQEMFVCPKDYYMFYYDYAQMEMRLFAEFANDPKLLNWFKTGIDPYLEMASIYFRKPKAQITKSQRDFVKTFTLAILYGIGVKGISKKYNKTYTEAKQLRFRFHEAFPLIKKYNNHIIDKVKQDGYIRNPYGRKRRLTEREGYKAMNSLIQGTGADMLKQKINEVSTLLRSAKSYLVNNIHDELQVAIHKSELELIPEIKQCMETFDKFDVHMKVDIDYTKTNWRVKTPWEGAI